MAKKIKDLARLVDGKVLGNSEAVIEGITHSEAPLAGYITFVQDEKAVRPLESSPITCLIVPEAVKSSSKNLIQVKNPKFAWARLLREFYPPRIYGGGISPQAVISQSARIGKDVIVEAFVKIGDEAEIGDNCVLRSHVFIDDKVKIGKNCVLHPGVMVYENCRLGSRVILHAGSVVGADGFGYVATPAGQEKVPQVGNVVIEDDVEIGACTTVDRATVGSTIIGKGSKIDNLVQIAHNVTIGPHTVISSQTGISGSTRIGSHVTMGGKVGVGDHCEIGDGVMVGAGAGFPSGKKIPPRQIVFGAPARPYHEARRQIAAQLRSAEMHEDIRKLKKRVEQLEQALEKSAPPKRVPDPGA